MISGLSFFTFSEILMLILKSYCKPLALQAYLSSTKGLSGEGEGCNRLKHFENYGKFCLNSGHVEGGRASLFNYSGVRCMLVHKF